MKVDPSGLLNWAEMSFLEGGCIPRTIDKGFEKLEMVFVCGVSYWMMEQWMEH